MPWGLLARIASMFVVARVVNARRRQGRAGGSAASPGGAAATATFQRTVRSARETAGLVWRLVVAALFGVATSLCIAAGTSSAVLSPRWLGIVLLCFGAGFAVLTVREAMSARAVVTQRRLRRRDARVRTEV